MEASVRLSTLTSTSRRAKSSCRFRTRSNGFKSPKRPQRPNKPMKIRMNPFSSVTLLAALGLLAFQSARAQFTFPVYEPFSEYPQGEFISKNQAVSPNSYLFWGNGVIGNSGSTNSSPVVTNVAAMRYPGLKPDPNTPAMGIITATGIGRTATASFTPQSTSSGSGTVYESFLLNIQTLPTTTPFVRAITGLYSGSSTTPNPNAWRRRLGQLIGATADFQIRFRLHWPARHQHHRRLVHQQHLLRCSGLHL